MRAAVGGVLAVDEREESLAVAAVGVGEAELQRLARVVERRIDGFGVVRLQVRHHEVEQAVARLEGVAVEDELEAGVEVAVMPQPPLDELRLEFRFGEDGRVRLELDERAVEFLGFALVLLLEFALLERRLDELALALAAHQKRLRQRVDRFGADAIEADAELEHVVIVFGAGVDLGDAVDDFAQRDAAPVIAHRDDVGLDVDLDLFAVAHDVFIDGVIDDLLQEDVAAVVVVRAVAEAPDVHAGAQADVLDRGERLDLALVIDVLFIVGHNLPMWKSAGNRHPVANRKPATSQIFQPLGTVLR